MFAAGFELAAGPRGRVVGAFRFVIALLLSLSNLCVCRQSGALFGRAVCFCHLFLLLVHTMVSAYRSKDTQTIVFYSTHPNTKMETNPLACNSVVLRIAKIHRILFSTLPIPSTNMETNTLACMQFRTRFCSSTRRKYTVQTSVLFVASFTSGTNADTGAS